MLRVALYIRVSTEEQAKFGISLAAQEDYLVRYANEQGYKIVKIYRDEGCSARKPVSKRPVMLELLEDVKAKKFDRVLITKFDRWSRNVREYHNVQAILDANGVTWQAVMPIFSQNTTLLLKVLLMSGRTTGKFSCTVFLRDIFRPHQHALCILNKNRQTSL